MILSNNISFTRREESKLGETEVVLKINLLKFRISRVGIA